ncbi:hypothetical protein SAMN05444414_1612 [Roseovarius marisflavi]|uniref:Uncharacterized protein n=1 Tax=Roseovarius marisflavi TaxID=1054996 RepID=A0A1M7DZK4_9RHOB|nr:hypothetical protein [Roseovarius marisflavi]SHL84887.1 hypothetical protein SAMN05444414_1612 [Roseovarius marisflavi]
MNSDKAESSNLFRRQRESLGQLDRPSLADHIGSDELLSFLLPHLFGAHFPKNELLPVPYSIDEHRFLQIALQTGKIHVACDKILDALKSGFLTLQAARLQTKDHWGQRHRVSASDLDDLSASDVVADFLDGACLGPDTAFPEWLHGKTFFLQDAEVEHWINCLEPMSHLPTDVERDGDLLPNRTIFASEAICWIAGQEIRDWFGLIETGAVMRDSITALQAYDGGTYDDKYYSAAQNFCLLLAEKHVRSHAANEIIQSMREGRLTGYGVPDHQSSDTAHSEFKTVPKTAFLIQREFSSNGNFTDCLFAASTSDRTENQQASNEADWTYVRFQKEDLIKIWGRNPEDDSNRWGMEKKSERPMRKNPDLPVRIPKMREAEAHVKKLVDCWKPGDFAPKRDIFVHELKEQFELSRDEARQLWSKVPWKKVGRPKAPKSPKKPGRVAQTLAPCRRNHHAREHDMRLWL